MELDLTTLDTSQRMRYEFHAKRQDAIAAEIKSLTAAVTALDSKVDALDRTRREQLERILVAGVAYEQSRLFRALRWLRLIP
jgi:hypothetical protein